MDDGLHCLSIVLIAMLSPVHEMSSHHGAAMSLGVVVADVMVACVGKLHPMPMRIQMLRTVHDSTHCWNGVEMQASSESSDLKAHSYSIPPH